MKKVLFAATTALFMTAAACSNTAPSAPDASATESGGSTGSGGTTSSGSGGTTSSGSGGITSPGSGGTTSSGSGGTTSSGSGGTSSSGTGGVVATGGTVSTGGTVGTGGASTGGVVGTGGAATGGVVGTGGSSTGGTTAAGGSKGSGGATGSGGAGGAADLTSIAASFDGQLLTFPCGPSHSGYDCDNVGCSNGTVTHSMTYTIGGTAGAVYSMTFNVRGVVEAYAYVGGTRAAGSASVSQRATNGGLFCSGGSQETAGNGNDYNTYELDVSPPVTGEANTYYLNSVIAAENPHTSSATQHLTFDINYNATIKVTGGGTLTFKTYDSNCKEVQNCGPTQGNQCQAPRSVSLAGVTPAAPSSFTQPFQMPTGAYGQWVYFDVLSVTAQ